MSNLGLIEIFFSILALTHSVNLLRPISTFAPIGMLDLGWTSALTPSVKLAWDCIYEIYFHYSLQKILSNCILYVPLLWVLLCQIFMYSRKQGSIASKWIFKNFNSWGKSMQCTPWAVISNNNPMVGTIKKFLWVESLILNNFSKCQ